LTEMRWCALAMTVLLLASARTAAAQTITEFPLPIRTSAHSIVAGPDGALWFAGDAGKKIGRITTAGTVTEFLIPVPPAINSSMSRRRSGRAWTRRSKRRNSGNAVGSIIAAVINSQPPA
jgi:streptogramin lyase